MKQSWVSQFAMVLVALIAFVDGILVAQHFIKQAPETTAAETILIEDVFPDLPPLPAEVEVVEEAEPLQPPFTTQAPHGIWSSPWSDYAEEAVALMAMQGLWGNDLDSKDLVADELLALGTWESEQFGDSILADMSQMQRIFKEYFNHEAVQLWETPDLISMQDLLEQGAWLIVPVNGQVLDNPRYGDPAPEHHMILLFDVNEEGFVAHDPGTRYGEATIYDKQKILDSIQDLDGSKRVLIMGPYFHHQT